MMDRPQEIITQREDLDKKEEVDGQTWRSSPTSISAEVSKVLDVDDLLIEILLRVDSPTTLVRAAAVCRRWLHHASDHTFLHRFRELHPPHLLSFYINPCRPRTIPRFVPMLPQPLELAAVIHRASSSLDTYKINGAWANILNCWDDKLLINHYNDRSGSTIVHNLMCTQRRMGCILPEFPIPPPLDVKLCTYQQILSQKEKGSGTSYLYVLLQCGAERKHVLAHIYMLRDGVWCLHNLRLNQIEGLRLEPKCLLVGSKLYMPAAERDIIVLDLMDSTFSTIQLPRGVKYASGNTMFSRAGDATNVYLVHVKEFQIFLWLHNVDDWLLVDNICVPEMCASLSTSHWNASLRLKHVGDNAEFVFLEMDRCILHWDMKRKIVHKVYEATEGDQWLSGIFPFMMTSPPKFPVLKDDSTRFSC